MHTEAHAKASSSANICWISRISQQPALITLFIGKFDGHDLQDGVNN